MRPSHSSSRKCPSQPFRGPRPGGVQRPATARKNAVCLGLAALGMLGVALLPEAALGEKPPVPWVDVTLSDWGISDPAEIGYVSAGILHEAKGDRMVLYEISRKPPEFPSAAAIRRRAPEAADGLFLVSHFAHGNLNALGGYFNSFGRKPSQAHTTLSESPDGRRALRFSYFNQLPGYAGFWVHLFDMKKTPVERIFFDSKPFSEMTFLVRGERGGERVLLKLADHDWEMREDAIAVGEVASFLAGRQILDSWQEARIPMRAVPREVNRRELASVVFEALGPSTGRIFIRDLAFVRKSGARIPAPASHPLSERAVKRALWVWETDKLLSDPPAVERFLRRCGDLEISDVFIQVPFRSGSGPVVWDVSAMAELVRKMHRAGLSVHGLDGDPRFALSEHHAAAEARVRSVAQYNSVVAREARFDGFRFDNEPYLLPGFGGSRKESILRQYLDQLRRTREILARSGIEFGVDLPFWFDAKDEFFRPVAELDGRALSEHVIDIADNIGLMAYRTGTYGPDGVLEISRGELDYASGRGKRVFIGLETVDLPDETLLSLGREGKASSVYIGSIGGGKARIQWLPPEMDGRPGLPRDAVPLRELRATHVSADKITFARRGLAELDDVVLELTRELAPIPGFSGFAFHSYEGLCALGGTGGERR